MTVDFSEIVAFIQREVPPPFVSNLKEGTQLRDQLRMYDEDAQELIVKFFDEFSVAQGDFNFDCYFPPAGFWPFRRRGPKPVPLTLGMLLQAARAGVWNTVSLEQY